MKTAGALNQTAVPLTLDLPGSMIMQLETARKANGFKTVSETVRFALARCDLGQFTPSQEKHIQISVRIPRLQRADLKRAARLKRVAVGELVRAAIENLKSKRKR